MDTAVTFDRQPGRRPNVTLPAVLMASPVQTGCSERAPISTEQARFGRWSSHRTAPLGGREPVHQWGLEAEGKIEGTGTRPVRRRVCTWGWCGTRRCAAQCRDERQYSASVEEIACSIRSAAIDLDGAAS